MHACIFPNSPHYMNYKRTCFRVRIADIPSVGNYKIRGKKTKFSVIYEDAKEKGRYTYVDGQKWYP